MTIKHNCEIVQIRKTDHKTRYRYMTITIVYYAIRQHIHYNVRKKHRETKQKT